MLTLEVDMGEKQQYPKVELLTMDTKLAAWLTSNPQHFNPRNALTLRCPDPVSLGLMLSVPWPNVPDGVYDPADIRLGYAKKVKYTFRPSNYAQETTSRRSSTRSSAQSSSSRRDCRRPCRHPMPDA
jgi:hypothetical protein